LQLSKTKSRSNAGIKAGCLQVLEARENDVMTENIFDIATEVENEQMGKNRHTKTIATEKPKMTTTMGSSCVH